MQTEAGHYYALDMVLSGPLAVTSDWLGASLATRYPADVVSVSPAVRQADTWTHTRAVIRWKGQTGDIEAGDTIESQMDVMAMTPISIGATATIVAVTDLGLQLIQPGGSFTNYVVSAALIAYTVFVGWQIHKSRRAAA